MRQLLFCPGIFGFTAEWPCSWCHENGNSVTDNLLKLGTVPQVQSLRWVGRRAQPGILWAETLRRAHLQRPDPHLPPAGEGQQFQGSVQDHNLALSPGHLTKSQVGPGDVPLADWPGCLEAPGEVGAEEAAGKTGWCEGVLPLHGGIWTSSNVESSCPAQDKGA